MSWYSPFANRKSSASPMRIAGHVHRSVLARVDDHVHGIHLLADVDDDDAVVVVRALVGEVRIEVQRAAVEAHAGADEILIRSAVLGLGAGQTRHVVEPRGPGDAQVLQRIVRTAAEAGLLHMIAAAVVGRDDVGDVLRREHVREDEVRLPAGLVLGVEAVRVELELVGRAPLEGRVHLGPLVVAELIQAAGAGRQDHARSAGRAVVARARVAVEGDGPVEVDVRVRHVEQGAHLSAGRLPAIRDQGAGRVADLLGVVSVDAPGIHGRRPSPREVERLVEPEIDDAGDAALDEIRRVRLVDVRSGECLGGQVLEREAPAHAREYLAPVEGREDVADSADDGVDDLVVVADHHLHARHALQRRGGGVVRELADILGDDGIDDLIRVLLDLRGRIEAGAQTEHHDLLEVLAARFRRPGLGLRRERPSQHGRRRHGAQNRISQSHTSP